MKKPLNIFVFIAVYAFTYVADVSAQARIDSIEKQLIRLSETTIPALKTNVNVSVSGVSIQEFIRGIAIANKLNITVDQGVNVKISNNFNDISALNILVFLARQYQLNIEIFGTIISISKYNPQPVIPKTTPLLYRIQYDRTKQLIFLDVKNDTLEKITRRLSELTQRNIVLAPGITDLLVTSFIQSASLESALDKLALSNNLRTIRNEDSSFLIEKKEQSTTILGESRNSIQSSGLLLKVDKDSSGASSLITFNAQNVPISDIIKDIGKKLNLNYFLYAELKGNITLSLVKMHYLDVINHLFKGTEYTITKEGAIYLIGDRKIEGLRTTKIIQLKYRSVEIIIDNIPTELKKNVELKSFPELNSIILSGSAPAIQDIEAFINEMDKLVPMVLIEVIVLDVNKSNTISTGIKAGINDTIKTGGTFLSGLDISMNANTLNELFSSLNGNGIVNIGRVSPNFYVSLKALEDRKNIRIRSTPKLSTLNGHPATLKIGQTQYYRIETQNVIGSQTTQTVITQQFNQVNADLNIKIEPFVSGDNQVTLKVEVEFSNFTGTPTLNAPPSTATRQFKSMIRIKNEEMVILGGLEEMEKSETGSGVPLLSRIPIIKWLFSSRTKTDRNSKLIVIVKPTIVN